MQTRSGRMFNVSLRLSLRDLYCIKPEAAGVCIQPCLDTRKGVGVFATVAITKGTFIVAYGGELITLEHAISRYPPLGNTDNIAHAGTLAGTRLLRDPDGECVHENENENANWARFFNHSDRPNCEARLLRPGHLILTARANIAAGEELCWDYGSDYDTDFSSFSFTQ
jgi:SET domain-containing protein